MWRRNGFNLVKVPFMRPENRILIDILNDRFDDYLSGIGPEQWDTFAEAADRHRLSSLAYAKIKASDMAGTIPETVLQKLRQKYLATAYCNTVFYHQLNDLVEHLSRHKIPVMLLKGAHLAEFLYGDIALRPMSDIDIMVKEDHLSETVRVAMDAGFHFFVDRIPEREKKGSDYDYGVMPDFKHFQVLIHPETKCLLEIHVSVVSRNCPIEVPVADLWAHARSENFYGNTVFVLSPEDLIIHLCLHAAYDHLFEFGISALYDIAVAIKCCKGNLDWDLMLDHSNGWGTNRCLWLTLYLTRKWLKTDIPDIVFKDFTVDIKIELAEARLFKAGDHMPLHSHYIAWRNLHGVRKKLRYMIGALFPERNFMANRYLKKKSAYLHGAYVLRFFQAIRGIWGLLKMMVANRRFGNALAQADNGFLLRQWLEKS